MVVGKNNKKYRHRIIFTMFGKGILLLFLLFSNTFSAFSHEPHDDIFQLEISPTYSEDKVLFIIVRNCIFKSEDGGESWIRLVKGLDYKGFLHSLAISSQTKNDLYLSSLGDGVYRSENGGVSWQKVNSGLKTLDIELLAVSPYSKQSVIAVGKKRGMYKTDTGGKSWNSPVLIDKKITAIKFLTDDKNNILAGDNEGILYISYDSGRTWKEIFDFKYHGAITVIALSPEFSKDDTFFVGTEKGGVFKTTNRGISFKQARGDLRLRNVRDIRFLPRQENNKFDIIVSTWHKGVFISTDEGRSWHNCCKGLTRNFQAEYPESLTLAEGSPPRRPHFSEIRVSNNFINDKTIFLAGFDGLFKSVNGGKSWKQLDTFSRVVAGIAISPNYKKDSTIAVATYADGAYLSNDAGENWVSLGRDLRYIRDKVHYFTIGPNKRQLEGKWLRFFDIAFSPDYAADETIYLTPLWQMIKVLRCTQKECLKTSFSDSAPAIGFSPDFKHDDIMYLATQKGKLWVSKDKGKAFKNIGEVTKIYKHASVCFVVSPDFLEDKTLYYASYEKGGLYKSKDGGHKWSRITNKTPLEQRSNIQVAVSPDYKNDSTLIAGTDEGVYISQDAGKSWLRSDSPPEVREGLVEAVAISPDYKNDKTILISIRGKGLFKSEDNGLNFKHIGNDNISLSRVNLPSASMPIQFSPDYANNRTIYGHGSAGAEIFKSTDGGEVWQIIPIPKRKKKITDFLIDKVLIANSFISKYIKEGIRRLRRIELIRKVIIYKKHIGAGIVVILVFSYALIFFKRLKKKKTTL